MYEVEASKMLFKLLVKADNQSWNKHYPHEGENILVYMSWFQIFFDLLVFNKNII